MRLNPSLSDIDLSPVWTTIAWATATLWANWVWGAWFSRAKDVEIALLAMASLLGWPLMLALMSASLAYTLARLQDHFLACAGIVLAVLGAGWAIYGLPGPWSLLVCAVVSAAMGLTAHREAQDEADLEDL